MRRYIYSMAIGAFFGTLLFFIPGCGDEKMPKNYKSLGIIWQCPSQLSYDGRLSNNNFCGAFSNAI